MAIRHPQGKDGKFTVKVSNIEIRKWIDEGYTVEQMVAKCILAGCRNSGYWRNKIQSIVDTH